MSRASKAFAGERIYGRYPVLEALRSSKSRVKTVFLAEGIKPKGVVPQIIAQAKQDGVALEWVARRRLERLTGANTNHQGVVAEVAPFAYGTMEELLARAAERGEEPFLLLLDGIQDVHNFGALLRTAEVAGVHGVIIPKRRAVGVTATVYKSSAGAVHHLPIVQVTNVTQCIELLQRQEIWVVGLDMDGKMLYHEANLTGGLAMVVGGEGKGLSRRVKESCDFLVRLPMRGQIESLNASVAGAILIYESLKQRSA